MIPKIIHYCWFGKNEQPPLVKKCIANWRKTLPDYQIKLWDETNSPMDIPCVKYAYKKKHWAFVSDYVRIYAVFHEGGIYLDTDTEVIRDFSPLLNNHCFVGFSQKRYVTNAVLGGEKGFHFLKDMLSFMDQMHSDKKSQLTSPKVTTAVLKKYGLNSYGEQLINGVKILPTEAFYPYNPFDPDRPLNNFFYEDVKPETYSVHHYMASWNKQTWIQKIINYIKSKK
ncbi:glycosyltransferase family 32 protein [Ekhidna sp.]|uniref:glycosyltransferase family 32 protein n=1 Tax=Ekhidna sp. TaxID=2608089 RepID=UPI003CCBB060